MNRPLNKKKLAEMERRMQHAARFMDAFLNPNQNAPAEEKLGFAMLVFTFQGSELTWLSNAPRPDMIKMMRELIQRWESGNTISSLEKEQRQEPRIYTSSDILGTRHES